MPAIEHFWAVVPAGGSGTRLWPLSRSDSPKFLHDLTGSGRSLLQETADRLAPLAGDRLLVVTGDAAPRPGRRAAARGPRRPGGRRAVASRLDGRDRPGRSDPRAPRPGRGDGLVRRRPRRTGPRGPGAGGDRRRRGRARRLAGHDRHRAEAAVHGVRIPPTGRRARGARGRLRRRGVRGEAERRARSVVRRVGRLPLERRDVRRPADRPARPAGLLAPRPRRRSS